MSDKPKVYIAGVGMITAVGADAEMTAAAVKAGVCKYQNVDEHDKNVDPFRMALVPEEALPPLNEKLETLGLTAHLRRLIRLSTSPLQEAMKCCPRPEPLPLFLAGPEALPERNIVMRNGNDMIRLMSEQAGVEIDVAASRIFATGDAGGFQAIDMAFRYFEATGNDYALVGGVDSYLDLYLLASLDKEGRILTEDSHDGFVPGEGAAFLLLMSENARRQVGIDFPALYLPGLENEPGHRYSEEPYRGDGLASAFRQAIDNAGDVNEKPVGIIYSGMNGESLAVKEFGVAVSRNTQNILADVLHQHPADCIGDVGAAFVPVLSALALAGTMHVQAQQSTLISCSSDGALRGAMLVVK